MNLPELCIRRPVMTTLVMSAILLFGIGAFRKLPVSDLPNVDYPTIAVSAGQSGASPQTMASAVATPLEREFSTISGLDSMNSSSAQGTTQITLQFILTRDLDAAALDVQSALTRAQRNLPAVMTSPPSFRKVNPADQPVLFLALTSPTLPLSTLNEYGDTLMAPRISMVDGVAQVLVYGSQKYAVRVQLRPEALASRGIGIDEVSNAIQAANVNLPTGILYGSHIAFTVQATGQLMRAIEYGPQIIAYRNGAPVKVEDVGGAIDSVEVDKVAAWFCTPESQDRGIILAILRQPGTNTIEVVTRVKDLIPRFEAQLPAAVTLNILYDRSVPIRDSYEDVQFTLLLTLGLVILVIFIFLRKLSATVIPSLALPMSIVGTFLVMFVLNYSLDNLSLMALTLSVGFVVDDAIVMLENIVRHTEMGKSRMQAAFDGSREIGFTIISMTLSLAAVFIPVVFMGGVIGRLFREFAISIGAAVLVSGVVSLTLTPMLCSRFLRAPGHQAHEEGSHKAPSYNWMTRIYAWMLRITLRHPHLTMLVSLGILVWTVFLFIRIPWGFLPSEDRSQIMVQTEAREGISFDSLVDHQKALANIVQKDENVAAFMSTAGARGGSGSNVGRMFIRLKPRAERKLNVDEVIEKLRPRLAAVPGIRAIPQNPPTIPLGGMQTRSQYQITLQGPDTTELFRCAQELRAKMEEIPTIQDIASDLQLRNPELNVRILRDQALRLGVSPGQIEDALYTAYGSRQISTIFAPDNQYQVIMELEPLYQTDPLFLSLLYVRSTSGQLVPLKAVVDVSQGVGPLIINHFGQLPSVTLSFNLRPGESLGPAVEAVNEAARSILPLSIGTSFQGSAQAFQAASSGLLLLLGVAVLVIYLVLGILYESFIHPLTILSALPFAGFGAFLTLRVFNLDLSIYAMVGIIMLIGLVKKNGIMMVDFAIEARRIEGKSARDAIYEACLIRFRPIMMTTMAALMGSLPIAVGYGAGAESRQPLGLAVVGGLVFSQSLTLFVTPVFYLYMEALSNLLRRKPKAAVPAAAPVRESTR